MAFDYFESNYLEHSNTYGMSPMPDCGYFCSYGTYNNPFMEANYYVQPYGNNLIFDYGISSYSPTYNSDTNYFDFYGYRGSITSTESCEETNKEEKTNKSEKPKKEKNEAKKQTKSKFEKVSPKVTRQFVENAQKYLGYNEEDKSFHKFSYSTEWCGDFVSYIIKETFKQNHIPIPDGIVNHRVVLLKKWAEKNNVFTSTINKQDKASFISKNIKPGDIMILYENGDSHVGFVVEVRKDGSFKTIEGNRYDKVDYGEYDANYKGLSGFVQLN